MRARDQEIVAGLVAAYRAGFFPMADADRPGGRIAWFNPDPRCVIPLALEGHGEPGPHFHASRSLRRVVRQRRFVITTNRAFEAVIRACAGPRRGEPGSWIDDRIVRAYTLLHRAGHAHSVEAWSGGVLVGGLYGVHVGSAFFAESKFSRPDLGGTDASKATLVHLVHHLRRRGFSLLDVQFRHPHLEQFGAIDLPRDEYLARVRDAASRPAAWLPFDPDLTAAQT